MRPPETTPQTGLVPAVRGLYAATLKLAVAAWRLQKTAEGTRVGAIEEQERHVRGALSALQEAVKSYREAKGEG